MYGNLSAATPLAADVSAYPHDSQFGAAAYSNSQATAGASNRRLMDGGLSAAVNPATLWRGPRGEPLSNPVPSQGPFNIWSDTNNSATAAWPKDPGQMAEQREWVGSLANGDMPGVENNADYTASTQNWGKVEVNQRTMWNVDQAALGRAPEGGQWPSSLRYANNSPAKQPSSFATPCFTSPAELKREESSEYFQPAMPYGGDGGFNSGPNYCNAGLQLPHQAPPMVPSQQWAMQSGHDFGQGYGANAWMQSHQRTPPPVGPPSHPFGSNNFGRADNRMMLSRAFPPPMGAQKLNNHAAGNFQYSHFSPSMGGAPSFSTTTSHMTPSELPHAVSNQFGGVYPQQQQQQQGTTFQDDSLIWQDPNSALRKWQELTGTVMWGEPDDRSQTRIRLWEDRKDKDDNEYEQEMVDVHPHYQSAWNGGWGDLPSIDGAKFKHHHHVAPAAMHNNSLAYGPGAPSMHRTYRGSQQQQPQQYGGGGGGGSYHAGRHFSTPLNAYSEELTHPPPLTDNGMQINKPLWAASAQPSMFVENRDPAECLSFDPMSPNKGNPHAPPYAAKRQGRPGGHPMQYPREEGLAFAWPPQSAGETTNEATRVPNLVDELSAFPISNNGVDRCELGPMWQNIPSLSPAEPHQSIMP